MFDLRKLFAWDNPDPEHAEADSTYRPSMPGEGLEVEYQTLIAAQFRRIGIHEACTTIEVKRIGHGPHGHDVLVGMIRLHRWERTSGLRLLIGLPLLEARIRKIVRSSWLADYSHFGGLWLHASEQLHDQPGIEEVRDLLVALTPPDPGRESRPEAGAADASPSSVGAVTPGASSLPG